MKCVNCRAPVDVPATGLEMKCAYCGHTMPVPDAAARRAEAEQARRSEQARHSSERAHSKAERAAAGRARHVARARRWGGLASLFGLLPILAIVAVSTHALWLPTVRGMTWDGSKTFVCELNQKHTFREVKATISSGPAFELGTNCTIKCIGCVINAETIANVGINGVLELQGGRYTAEDMAFDYSGPNGKVRAHDTAIRAETLVAGSRPHVELRGSTVTSEDVALDLPSHATAHLRNTELRARLPLRMDNHAKVSIHGGSLIGDEVAASVGNHAELVLRAHPSAVGIIETHGRYAVVKGRDELVPIAPEDASSEPSAPRPLR